MKSIRIKAPLIFLIPLLSLHFTLIGNVPPGKGSVPKSPEEILQQVREELKDANESENRSDRKSDEEKELERQLAHLIQEENDRYHELLRAFVNLPPEEIIEKSQSFHQETIEHRARYKAEEERLRASLASIRSLPSLPDRQVDRWEFLSFMILDGKADFSLNNPWEGKAFWAGLKEKRHGIETIEWNDLERTILIRSGEDLKTLKLGSKFSEDRSPKAKAFREETISKYQTTLNKDPKLKRLNNEFEEITSIKASLDEEFRQITSTQIERPLQETIDLRNRLIKEGNQLYQQGSDLISDILDILKTKTDFSNEEAKEIRTILWSQLVQSPK